MVRSCSASKMSRCTEFWSQSLRRAGAKVFSKRASPQKLKKVEEGRADPGWGARSGHEAPWPPAEITHRFVSDSRQAGSRSPRRLLDLWGWKGGYLLHHGGRMRSLLRRARFILAKRLVAPNCLMVQHRLHWPYGIDGPGQGLITSTGRPAHPQLQIPLRAPQPARPASSMASMTISSRGRHPGTAGCGERACSKKIRSLRHRSNFSSLPAKVAPVGRRLPLVRPDDFRIIGGRAAGAIASRAGTTAPRLPRWSVVLPITPISRPISTEM